MRRVVVAVIALLLAAAVLRNSAVLAFVDERPGLAQAFWPGNPVARIQTGMTEIALAARQGKAVDPDVLSAISEQSARAPLAAEPFLVRGVQQQIAGDRGAAEHAFAAAEWRDGRSLPARYFLAESYFHRGDAAHGLTEIAALGRLFPEGTVKLAPYVASYARDRANWPRLRRLFADEPPLEEASLAALAADPRNADVVLALASPGSRRPDAAWFQPLMQSLMAAGQYQRARHVWALVSHVDLARAGLLFDPSFKASEAPPPFNWSLLSSSVGFAERQPSGGLHLLYYGHDSGPLAGQLLVLPPGPYAIRIEAPGYAPNDGAMRLSLTCQGSNAALVAAPLDEIVNRTHHFTLGGGCPAQQLQIIGSLAETPQQREAVIRAIHLERSRG